MGTTMRRVIKQVEELRRRKKYLQVRLEQIFLKAFKLCDVNNDGDVSMEECIVLDKQVREIIRTNLFCLHFLRMENDALPRYARDKRKESPTEIWRVRTDGRGERDLELFRRGRFAPGVEVRAKPYRVHNRPLLPARLLPCHTTPRLG